MIARSILALFLMATVWSCENKKKQISNDLIEESDATPDSIGDIAITNDTMRFEYQHYQDLLDLMADLNYTPESWRSGNRDVPRAFISRIPERWRNQVTKEIDVPLKKRIFFRGMAPLALYSNEVISSERERIRLLRNKSIVSWTDSERSDMIALAKKYKTIGKDATEITGETLESLWIRVDEIPISLVLAQSAEESGWGTSRFAAEGNALFGQWAWGEKAMKPEQQRSGMGDYGIARFNSPLESMQAYMLNLNTHNAYADLRKRRAEIRANGGLPTGRVLATTLTKYSERGEEYVKSLHGIMNVNKLDPTDSTTLMNEPVILLIPIDNPAQ